MMKWLEKINCCSKEEAHKTSAFETVSSESHEPINRQSYYNIGRPDAPISPISSNAPSPSSRRRTIINMEVSEQNIPKIPRVIDGPRTIQPGSPNRTPIRGNGVVRSIWPDKLQRLNSSSSFTSNENEKATANQIRDRSASL